MYLRVRKFGAETSDRSVASSRETAQQTRGDRAKRKTRGARKVGCIENGGEGGGGWGRRGGRWRWKDEVARAAAEPRRSRGAISWQISS